MRGVSRKFDDLKLTTRASRNQTSVKTLAQMDSFKTKALNTDDADNTDSRGLKMKHYDLGHEKLIKIRANPRHPCNPYSKDLKLFSTFRSPMA